jgi:hypothetical protein
LIFLLSLQHFLFDGEHFLLSKKQKIAVLQLPPLQRSQQNTTSIIPSENLGSSTGFQNFASSSDVGG